jgi:hypothetical protein
MKTNPKQIRHGHERGPAKDGGVPVHFAHAQPKGGTAMPAKAARLSGKAK